MHMLSTWSEAPRRLGAYYMENLDELSCMDIGRLSRYIEAPSGSWNKGECETMVSRRALCYDFIVVRATSIYLSMRL